MSYWNKPGTAVSYSRAVEAANERVKKATRDLQATLKTEYPKGAGVRVVHPRGVLVGIVTGWDADGARVAVHNNASGKTRLWWAAYVELLVARDA